MALGVWASKYAFTFLAFAARFWCKPYVRQDKEVMKISFQAREQMNKGWIRLRRSKKTQRSNGYLGLVLGIWLFFSCNVAEFEGTWLSHKIIFKQLSFSTEPWLNHDCDSKSWINDMLGRFPYRGLFTYTKGETWPHEQGEMSFEYSQNGSYGLLRFWVTLAGWL